MNVIATQNIQVSERKEVKIRYLQQRNLKGKNE